MTLFLGIETSCDETAAAVFTDEPRILSNVVASQTDLHARFGGVVPEVAARAHLQRLLPVIDEALAKANVALDQVGAIAVHNTPGLVGALLVGLSAAKALSVALDVPLIAVNHVHAHVYACRVAAGRDIFPCVGLVVSGGHTALFHCRTAIDLELLGTTRDDAAGEAFDKVAAILGLGFPGGPAVEREAAGGDPDAYKFPRSMLEDGSLDFSFSGVKTAVLYATYGQPSSPLSPASGERGEDSRATDRKTPRRPGREFSTGRRRRPRAESTNGLATNSPRASGRRRRGISESGVAVRIGSHVRRRRGRVVHPADGALHRQRGDGGARRREVAVAGFRAAGFGCGPLFVVSPMTPMGLMDSISPLSPIGPIGLTAPHPRPYDDHMIKGVSVSPGVAIARVYRLDEAMAEQNPTVLDPAALPAEVSRFENAVAAVAAELGTVVERVAREVGEDEAAIFRAHRALVRDPALVGKVTNVILTRGQDAATALKTVVDDYARLFEQIPDEYIRERLADIRDVANRITAQLSLQECPECFTSDEPVILAAPEIRPSQTVMFERLKVVGIITETGGTTGHAAILARALGIPAVSGLSELLRDVRTGDVAVIDGREGVVVINPGPEVESAYRKLQREYFFLRDRLVANRDQEAVSTDGVRAVLLANVNNSPDAVTAGHVGAVGVGLYRTEYLFLSHTSVPTEEEQYAAYRHVIESSPNKSVTIRTLDLGGDKQVPYLGTSREANPFMGWRSIRLSAAYPEFFQTQLRAILRAAVHGDVRLMFPMVSMLEEVARMKELIERSKAALRRDGAEFRAQLPIGVMVEVPGAALCVEDLLDEVDFVSIGSNDLIQYVMAADRDNPKVAHLCDPFTPAIYRLLYQLISTCTARGKPVTICGEMAGRPRCFLPLFGMGLRHFSMSPAFVPSIKELVRSIDRPTAHTIAKQVLRMRTTGEIKDYLTEQIRKLCPNVAIFDTIQ